MNNFIIKEISINDYEEIFTLWKNTEGMGLSEADSKENIDVFLKRNEGLSFAGLSDDKIVGTILCGNDGRRGYIHHLAVQKDYRNQGIATKLIECVLTRLKEENIHKCHLFVFTKNSEGVKFWEKSGWTKREDIFVFSKNS